MHTVLYIDDEKHRIFDFERSDSRGEYFPIDGMVKRLKTKIERSVIEIFHEGNSEILLSAILQK